MGYYDIVNYFIDLGASKEGLSENALAYIELVKRTRIRAANKIKFWWGPILRRINPGFVLREAEESWNRVEEMFKNKI
jgi:hypothetical protein